MTDTVQIILPPIHPQLHAHNTGHWRSKAGPTKRLKALAFARTKEATRQVWRVATVDYRFYVPDNRRRDEANMIHSQKPAIDGVVKAGLIPDDAWQFLSMGSVYVGIDRDNPRVVLTFRKVS